MRLLKLIARSQIFADPRAASSSAQLLVFRQQILFALGPVRIVDDAIFRTYQLALRLVLGADAFGAFHRIDDVNRTARRNRLVRTDRLAGIASRARFGDHQGHRVLLVYAALATSACAASLRKRNAPHNAAPIAPA